ncbi:MAG: helix-turn-helix domain-containing protein [Chitinophagaceae bacterium]
MLLRFYTTHPLLKDFISRIMLVRYKFDKSEPLPTNPFPPQPEHCLYFYPYNKVVSRNYATESVSELPHSILVGPQLSRVDLTMNYNMLIIYIGFQPGGMHRLLRLPMHEMIDEPFDSTLILGKEIEHITEQLNDTDNYDQMICLIQDYLLKKSKELKRNLPLDQVLMQIMRTNSAVNVDAITKNAFLSTRQLERQFKERIGMPPKVFARLVRFSNAWQIREVNPHISWTKIAYHCGYSDQMHMIRDFKDFAGVTPSLLQQDLERSSLRLQAEMTANPY